MKNSHICSENISNIPAEMREIPPPNPSSSTHFTSFLLFSPSPFATSTHVTKYNLSLAITLLLQTGQVST